MSEQPPMYPPPPPPPPAYGAPVAAGGYAPWVKRVGAYLIDALPVIGVYIVLGLFAGVIGNSAVSLLASLIELVVAIGWLVYNFGIQQGTTGYSLGKGVLGIKLISEETGAPIGTGLSIGRYFVHILDAIPCYVGYLWPLWDEKSQTFADKILKTVVIEAPKP